MNNTLGKNTPNNIQNEAADMEALEYRMEAHSEDIIIGEYIPNSSIRRNPEQELDEMTKELIKKYHQLYSGESKETRKEK